MKFKDIKCKDTGEVAADYNAYLKTKHWKQKRKEVAEHYKYECQRCYDVLKNDQFVIHHKTYKRLGDENLSDLTLYCSKCHAVIHRKRKSDRDINKHFVNDKTTLIGIIIEVLKEFDEEKLYKVYELIQKIENK